MIHHSVRTLDFLVDQDLRRLLLSTSTTPISGETMASSGPTSSSTFRLFSSAVGYTSKAAKRSSGSSALRRERKRSLSSRKRTSVMATKHDIDAHYSAEPRIVHSLAWLRTYMYIAVRMPKQKGHYRFTLFFTRTRARMNYVTIESPKQASNTRSSHITCTASSPARTTPKTWRQRQSRPPARPAGPVQCLAYKRRSGPKAR